MLDPQGCSVLVSLRRGEKCRVLGSGMRVWELEMSLLSGEETRRVGQRTSRMMDCTFSTSVSTSASNDRVLS
jgi:hypothetical protein